MLDLADVEAARDRVAETSRHTSLDYSHTFSARSGASVHLKLENLQRTGSFKIRGATNRIATLSGEERAAGVVTASAGNHGQGVALAASRADVEATIVMPEGAAISKVAATRHYGAEVVLHGAGYEEAAARAHDLVSEQGRTYVHAFDDPAVMAGQGTVGLEILEDCPDLETVVVPVGGGGLIAGIATAVTGRNPDVRVIGVQATGAPSAVEAVRTGDRVTLESVETIADGIATRRVGERTFEVIQARVDELVTVEDSDIAVAVTALLDRAKTLVEGAGAVPLAALLAGAFEYEDDEEIALVVSGGNMDLNVLTTVILRGLIASGRYLRIKTVLQDRPGALERLAAVIAAHDANIEAIQHDRTSRDVAMNAAEVALDLETRGHDHVEELLAALAADGYDVEVLI